MANASWFNKKEVDNKVNIMQKY